MTMVTGVSAYNRLFAANVLGLIATGIATVALALLAYDLEGDHSGAVLGTALSLKMAVSVVVPLLASAHATAVHRREWLVSLNLIRAGILLLLPFVDAAWQIYLLIVLFQSAAAASRATYLAIVPDMLPDEAEYARAVMKTRIAYSAEGLLSPAFAGLLLLFVNFRSVFVAAMVLFAIAATITAGLAIPAGKSALQMMIPRTAANIRALIANPALRGALAISAAAITVNAMVLVNTIVLVRGVFGLDDRAAAIGLAAFGAGSIIAALLLPRLISRRGERAVMIWSGAAMTALLVAGAGLQSYLAMIALWIALGVLSTLGHLPVELLLRRMTERGDRQGLYAAHYSIDSTLLLIAYLAAGWIGAEEGMVAAFISLGLLSGLMTLLAMTAWSAR